MSNSSGFAAIVMREVVVFAEFDVDMYSEYSQQSTEFKEEVGNYKVDNKPIVEVNTWTDS